MSQSAKFQEEICNQWLECENDEVDYHREQFGDNPTSFKLSLMAILEHIKML